VQALLGGLELFCQIFPDWIVWFVQIEDLGNGLSEPRLHDREPGRLQMRLDELLVDDVDARRRNRASDHVLRLVKEVSIVDVAVTREGHDKCRFPTATRSTATLSVVCGCGRHIAHVNCREVLNVDAEFHRWRTEQDWQLSRIEISLAQLPPISGYLSRMLCRQETFELALQLLAPVPSQGLLIESCEISVGLASCLILPPQME
jgi:hypothetical protein